MLPSTNSRKKPKSPGIDVGLNIKTSITCSDVPEGLFDPNTAKRHFSKFGKVQRIRLYPKRQMCLVEYEHIVAAEKAVLNAGAFDGFMFDVTRTKPRVRRKSKKEDDPDWVPDSDVEEELSAMGGVPTYRTTRNKSMEEEPEIIKPKPTLKLSKKLPIKKKQPVTMSTRAPTKPQITSGIESPIVVTTVQTSMGLLEAASELHQLRSRISLTPDEQWRTLDARDRILRSWGGAGARVKVGGATIGTCTDMCPEKERLHRQAEHQVMTLETEPNCDGQLEPRRAVKQYSRSSADQEIPMCYELRPASVLMRTCAYLLYEVADTTRQVSLADWFHFLWDRFRSIRKDITQQALCCAESIRLVEICARFHAHCAARLADLEHTQFDQKLNTDNLTKCLQTLKHMYTDVRSEMKPQEAEFRGYIALLNLGDSNFWWEIKQLPLEIQKSEPITFAILIFNALDNNNYVRFFRLVKERATYLQACILLRYFNDVRARALARIVKAYAPRGGSRFPADDLINALAFESLESMKSFISHYGLRLTRTDDTDISVILDRHQFIEDSDPYPLARSIQLIESKRTSKVCDVISGGQLPRVDYENHALYTSFGKDGKLKENALFAEEQGYSTRNDTNKDIQILESEVNKLTQGGKNFSSSEKNIASGVSPFGKPDINRSVPKVVNSFVTPVTTNSVPKVFSFKPAITVAPIDVIKNSPEKILNVDKSKFSFSKPQDTLSTDIITGRPAHIASKATTEKSIFESTTSDTKNVFGRLGNKSESFPSSNNIFTTQKTDHNIFKKPQKQVNIFQHPALKSTEELPSSIFGIIPNNAQGEDISANTSIFGAKKNLSVNKDTLFVRPDNNSEVDNAKGGNIFTRQTVAAMQQPSNIFKSVTKTENNPFMKPVTSDAGLIFPLNGKDRNNKLSPGTLFKNATSMLPTNAPNTQTYSIFQSKNKAQSVADNILNSVNNANNDRVYEFDQNEEDNKQEELRCLNEERIREQERKLQQRLKEEEEKKLKDLQLREEERRREEARRKQEELRQLEEKRKKEEARKQEELKKKLEAERKAEIKRKEEENKKIREAVENKSNELVNELIQEVTNEEVSDTTRDEKEKLKQTVKYAGIVTEQMLTELCDEICNSEVKAEKFWFDKTMRKWFNVWKKHYLRNYKRRCLLDDTPVWLCDKTPVDEASQLRRSIENATLKNMNAFHRGYRFIGELKPIPLPEPYNIMELIRSPLLKRMKQINYPYDKCFFWKVTLVSPGQMKWLHRKIEMENWLHSAFNDKQKHESQSLIQVNKVSWNHLMDFAISVSLTCTDRRNSCQEAIEGTNAIIFYATENEGNLCKRIEKTLKEKYPYQLVPIAVIMGISKDTSLYNNVHSLLTNCVRNNVVSAFHIFMVESDNVSQALNSSTKSALKWLAKKCPQNPPLEIDLLKSICQRYLGNEIWCKLKIDEDNRMINILKDLTKLIKCYNMAVERLTDIITNENHFNYPSFPLEFKKYLDTTSLYPKPYEFIPSNVKNSENAMAIRGFMKRLLLPIPSNTFCPISVVNMQQQIREYCNQIGWFENPEEVVCKVITVLPNQLVDISSTCESFMKFFSNYDLIDILNIIVYEKINRLENFDNRYAIYEKAILNEYCNANWLYEISIINEIKHKALEYEDDVDIFIEAKRRKIAMDSIEYLMLEDKDRTLADEKIKCTDESISKYNDCTEAVKQLEMQLEEGKKKSIEFENFLKAALSNF